MRSLFTILFCTILWAQSAAAQRVHTIDDIPNPRTTAGGWVSNPDGVLSPSTVANINTQLTQLQATTSVEVAVVVVESIGDAAPEDFGIALFRNWGIGRKDKDNGLLILLVTADRIVRFDVGYGLEGYITDALSKRIQTQRMMPYLRSGDWNGAALAAVEGVREILLDPASDLHSGVADEPETNPYTPLLIVFGAMILMILVGKIASRKALKCPQCGAQMKIVDTKSVRLSPTVTEITTTMKCPKCGYTTTKKRRNNIGSAVAGGMIGGMMGGRGGFGGGRGGGFGGFGGGSAGGGGATTRF